MLILISLGVLIFFVLALFLYNGATFTSSYYENDEDDRII